MQIDSKDNKGFCSNEDEPRVSIHIINTSRIQKIGEHNELRKLDSTKTAPIVGQNPYPDMQVLPSMLVAGKCLKGERYSFGN